MTPAEPKASNGELIDEPDRTGDPLLATVFAILEAIALDWPRLPFNKLRSEYATDATSSKLILATIVATVR